jgi:competence protein ComEA
MDNSLQEKYLPILRKHWLPISLGALGLIFLSTGLMSLVGSNKGDDQIVFESAGHNSASGSAEDQEKQITVDIEGAVVKPGVYDLPFDSRVQDALIAAGGMSDKADRERVSKGLNLAAKLSDGGKIYIPFIGDSTISPGTGGGGDTVLGANSSLININTASASVLDKLQGVGPVTAEKIISNRPYSAIEELVSKKVVGQKVFEGIKDKISIY